MHVVDIATGTTTGVGINELEQPFESEDLPFAFRVPVSALMSQTLLVTHADDSVELVSRHAREHGVHHIVVVHWNGDLLGVICGCDTERAWPDARVRDCMSGSPMFIGPTQSLAAAAETMLRYGIGALPVLERSGRLIGIVTRSDLRSYGILPNQPGIDRCAACGQGHRLLPRRGTEVCFCRDCIEASRGMPGGPPSSEDPFVMLGGGD